MLRDTLDRPPWSSLDRSRSIVLVPAAIASVALAYVASRYGDQPWWEIVLPAAALATATITTIVFSHVRARDAFSPLSVTAMFYLASYVGGGIYFWFVRSPSVTRIAPVYDQSQVVEALVLAGVAFAAIVCGYVSNPLRVVLRILPPAPQFDDMGRRSLIVLSLLATGWAARLEQLATGTYFHVGAGVSSTTTGASWFVMAASQLPMLAAAFVGAHAFLLRRRGRRSGRMELLFYALFLTEAAWYVPTGSRGAVLSLLLMVAVIRYYALGRRPSWVSMLAGGAIALFVVFPLEATYRSTAGGYQRAPATNLKASAGNILKQSPARASANGFNVTFSRLSSITSVAAILHSGTHVLGIGPWDTLLWAGETVVPRALDPHKFDPALFGNEFGRGYGFLSASDRQTSIAVTQIGEFYLDFGIVGVLVGMCLVGGGYRLVSDYFRRRRSDPVALAVFSVAAWNLLNLQESIIAVGLFGLIKLMIFLLLSITLASRIQQRRHAVR